MKIITPDYYGDFHCIAGECRHTCCAGWEVPVDDGSLEKYRGTENIERYIEHEDGAHFRLCDGERCPFLNGEGLCSLIVEYGDDILCQTCRDHPRFRNYFTGITEMLVDIVRRWSYDVEYDEDELERRISSRSV